MNKTNKTEDLKKETAKKKVTSKQIAAIAGIVLLVLLYVVTLFAAIFDSSATGSLFQVCLFATIAIPLLIWIYVWMYGKLTQKSTFADLNIGGKPAQDMPEADTTSSARENSR